MNLYVRQAGFTKPILDAGQHLLLRCSREGYRDQAAGAGGDEAQHRAQYVVDLVGKGYGHVTLGSSQCKVCAASQGVRYSPASR